MDAFIAGCMFSLRTNQKSKGHWKVIEWDGDIAGIPIVNSRVTDISRWILVLRNRKYKW